MSVCSGIEAATVAWTPLGWTPVAFAEVDPFRCALLEHYWPHVPNLGDLTRITAAQVEALGPIDLVVGGTPCQDISVAGQRAGLDGARSRLFFDFVRVFHAARSFCGARWLLWENTPGAFTLRHGRDFARVVATLAGLDELDVPSGGWGNEGVALGPNGLVEWSELDAQWFDLAQRRERVFVVLDTGNWADRPPVLLEPESVRGDSAPSRAPGARVTGTLTPSALSCSSACGGDGRAELLQVANTLAANSGRLQIEQTYVPEVADPLVRKEAGTYTHEGSGNFRTRNVIVEACFDETQITHRENRSTCGPETAALARTARSPTIAYALRNDASRDGVAKTPSPDAEGKVRLRDPGFNVYEEVAPTLDTGAPPSVSADGYAVRRLTPRECERLQGFPDDFTLINWRGKPASDTQRYAALGDSIATKVLRWIGERIAKAHACSTP